MHVGFAVVVGTLVPEVRVNLRGLRHWERSVWSESCNPAKYTTVKSNRSAWHCLALDNDLTGSVSVGVSGLRRHIYSDPVKTTTVQLSFLIQHSHCE